MAKSVDDIQYQTFWNDQLIRRDKVKNGRRNEDLTIGGGGASLGGERPDSRVNSLEHAISSLFDAKLLQLFTFNFITVSFTVYTEIGQAWIQLKQYSFDTFNS